MYSIHRQGGKCSQVSTDPHTTEHYNADLKHTVGPFPPSLLTCPDGYAVQVDSTSRQAQTGSAVRRVPESQQAGTSGGGFNDFFKGELPKKLGIMLVHTRLDPES